MRRIKTLFEVLSWKSKFIILSIAVLSFCTTAQTPLDPDKAYRGVTFLSSTVNTSLSLNEIDAFISDCDLDFVVIDFAWITYHWPLTDLSAVEQLASILKSQGVQVIAMYRPRVLNPLEANIHYAQNADGTIDPSHNHLCFAYEDSVAWGVQWGNQILNALPSIDKIVIYNLLAPCCCQLCRNGQGAIYAQHFMERCRMEWNAVRPGVQIGHVGLGAEYADQVDFFCPFLSINRWGDTNPVDVASLLDALITPDSQPGNKPVVPLAKICWDDATDNTTEDIINTINTCENSQRSYNLWYYDWIFQNDTMGYDTQEIIQALGGQQSQTNPEYSWIYFESKESTEGLPPVLSLTLNDGSILNVPVAEDTILISYLADYAFGFYWQLAISMNDTNRDLLKFSLSGVPQGQTVQHADLILDMKQSDIPTVVPFDMNIHIVSAPWSELTATWNNQPAFQPVQAQTVSITPVVGPKTMDITDIVNNWLTGAVSNYGILLKVSGIPGLTFPYPQNTPEPLPWPHQAPNLTPAQINLLNQQVWVINDFPLYQADDAGSWRYFHGGLDIVLDNGTPIYAMKNGWVKSIDYSTITIADTAGSGPSYGWEYTHLGNFQVQVGDFVTRGTMIGTIDFTGLSHIHLTKVFSEGNYWGWWRYLCIPNGHFTYIDNEPPVISGSFYFFENNSDTRILPDGEGNTVLTGEVDIVVAMREQGLYARSKDNGYGDRLGVTKIEYEIRPAGSPAGSGRIYKSFDFNNIKIKSGIQDQLYSTDLTRVVYKHWTLFEPERTSWDKCFSYYIITNCSGQQSPQELNISDTNYCWNTAARDPNGHPLFPDGGYDITITASDFSGNHSSRTVSVTIENPITQLHVPQQYPTIQQAIQAAKPGDIIFVAPGVYQENIDFLGKAITVQGYSAAAIIDGLNGNAVSFIGGEGADTLLQNFIIRNGYRGILVEAGSPTIRNVTVCENEYGVAAYQGAQPKISNSIFWNNTMDDLFACYAVYSCIEDGDGGLGNICEDPHFVCPLDGDYRLKSEGGRWHPLDDPQTDLSGNGFVDLADYAIFSRNWLTVGESLPADFDRSGVVDFSDLSVFVDNYLTPGWGADTVTSRCIDAGNPAALLREEPLGTTWIPSGTNCRINIGAYGGTYQASLPPNNWSLACDLDNDGKVGLMDFAILSQNYNAHASELPGDNNHDSVIDIGDLISMAQEWLEQTVWY